jgi:ABC-type uncharacterized transport system involved in gliding motility auxiliary subunit
MDNKPQNRYSVIALIVSGAALVATLLVGVIKILINMGAFTPTDPQAFTLALQISAALILVGLAVYAILEPDMVRRFLSGRQARYGSNALVTILAFVGIVFVINYMMATNAELVAIKADLTENKVNTLSPEMVTAMQNLPAPLTATAFYTSQNPTDSARELFDDMRAKSDGKFDYSFIDPNKNPAAAKEAGVTGDGKILLEMSGRREIAAYADEAEILTALNRIMNPEQRTVYFLTGHGERNIDGTDDLAYSRARDVLEKKNIVVKSLNLIAENAIPEDAKAIIIAGPQTPLSLNEVGLLNDFALKGGALVILEDPTPLTEFGDTPDPLLDMLSNSWGLVLRNDFVVDTANSSSPYNAVGAIFDASHPITRPLLGQVVVLPLTRSIEVKTLEGFTLFSLVKTTPSLNQTPAWSETDFSPLQSNTNIPAFDQDVDVLGPLTLVAASQKTDGGSVILIGSSNFAADLNFDVYANSDLFVNAVGWAAGMGESIDITPKDTTMRTFKSPSQLGAISIYLGTFCVIPGLVMAAGVYAWASRRRRN